MLMPDLSFPLLRGFIDITRARIIRDWYRGGATLCGVTGHAFAAWPEDMARIAGHEKKRQSDPRRRTMQGRDRGLGGGVASLMGSLRPKR